MRVNYITLKGEKHPLCFSLSAVEAIIEAFGSLDAMTEAIRGDDVLAKLRATNKTLEIMMDAGRHYCAEMGIDMPPAIKCRPGDLIDITDGEAVRAIFSTISADNERTVEAKSKNADATPEEG